jgi:ABC-type Fe3+-hydroxamate transport system substrate-binding protein
LRSAVILGALAAGALAASRLGAEPAWNGSTTGETAPKSNAVERPDERVAEQRLISLNPSLTAIVVRLGGRERLVGVDDYSARVVEGVAELPRVGGLFDPSLESIAALRPDRVLLVAGVDQRSHAARLERLGLEVEIYENERLSEVLANIERVGRLIGKEEAAAARVEAIRAMVDAVAEATSGRAEPPTLAVVDRSPLYLVGGETFLDEMLAAVGARNLGRALGSGYPRGSIEWLIEARPELLIDMTPTTGESDSGAVFWSRWPSLPAVASGRVLTLDARRISLPGPDLDRALRELARAVHGDSIDSAIDAALGASDS